MSFSSNKLVAAVAKLLILVAAGIALAGCVSSDDNESWGGFGSGGNSSRVSDREWK